AEIRGRPFEMERPPFRRRLRGPPERERRLGHWSDVRIESRQPARRPEIDRGHVIDDQSVGIALLLNQPVARVPGRPLAAEESAGTGGTAGPDRAIASAGE